MSSHPQSCTQSPPSPLDGFSFTRDWLDGKEFARQFIAAPDQQIAERVKTLKNIGWQAWTHDETEAVAAFNREFGNHAGAELAESLSNSEAMVVVTGQQPDFLASPLYVLHKALSAVAWSKKLTEELGRPVIPVFWVASDDDDFAELKQAYHVDYQGNLVNAGAKLGRGSKLGVGTPAYCWNLEPAMERLSKDLIGIFKSWEKGSEISAWLLKQATAFPNFETLFCRLLTQLLGPNYPMLFIAPRLKPFRNRQIPILKRDIAGHQNLNQAINETAEAFEAQGYSTTLHRNPDALNFFLLHNNMRHRLIRSDGGVSAIEPNRNTVLWEKSETDLLAHIDMAPQDFAPNVVTRPILQDSALPSVAYIAGPGELAYLALLKGAYTAYNQSRAAVIPRTLVSMIPADPARFAGCFAKPENGVDSILSSGENGAGSILREIQELNRNTTESIARMRSLGNTDNSAVNRALDKTQAHIERGLDRLKRRLARQIAPDEWARANRLSSIISPAGSSQERLLAPWNFVEPEQWDSLAVHLTSHINYTSLSPQSGPLPPWVERQL